MPLRIPRYVSSLGILFAVLSASLLGFLLMHRGLELHPMLSSSLLTVVYLPLLIWALLRAAASILKDPDEFVQGLVLAFGFTALTILFFGVIYTELGIVWVGGSGVLVQNFTTCLYFSATTFTTVGYGDFAPTPESRLLASIEALTGYLMLGTMTGVLFVVLSRWSDRLGA